MKNFLKWKESIIFMRRIFWVMTDAVGNCKGYFFLGKWAILSAHGPADLQQLRTQKWNSRLEREREWGTEGQKLGVKLLLSVLFRCDFAVIWAKLCLHWRQFDSRAKFSSILCSLVDSALWFGKWFLGQSFMIFQFECFHFSQLTLILEENFMFCVAWTDLCLVFKKFSFLRKVLVIGC